MNRLKLMLIILSAILLGGCSRGSQVEDQSYVLTMGLDRTQDGQIEMSVQIPRISGASGESSSGGSGGAGNYLQMSVTAPNYEEALEKLDWASPRDVNLAQLKLIVISRDLAEEDNCGELIENIAQTERLFTATRMAVCDGSAKEFISSIQPGIGTRISEDIDSMFKHYNNRGYVPESSLAELYYQTESIYSDPMITFAVLDPKSKQSQQQDQAKQAAALSGSVQEISASYESDIPTRYLGAALFADGSMVGTLDGDQTILANFLRNELDSFRYSCDGQSLELVPTRQTFIRVDTQADPVQIHINAHLSYAAQEEIPDEAAFRRILQQDIEATIRRAQELGAEPFGFAERAARSFLTIDQWEDYNWRDRFRDAQILLKINFAQSDA